MGRRGHFCSPDCSGLFLISSQRGLTASKQALPIKQWMTVLAVSLRLRCRPHFSPPPQASRGNYFCQLTLSHPPFNHSSSTTSADFLPFCQFNSEYTCWLPSSSSLPNLNVNVTAVPSNHLPAEPHFQLVYIELLSGCHLLFVSSRRRCVT